MKTEYYVSSPGHGVLALRRGVYVWTRSGQPTVWFKRVSAEKALALVLIDYPDATLKAS